jgi:hypothetical protein
MKTPRVPIRETREGWPLPDCWNCGEWGLKEYKLKGVLPWLVHWACLIGKEIFVLPLLLPAEYKFFFLTVQYTILIPLRPHRPAGQAAMLCRLSLSMCLWSLFSCFVFPLSFIPMLLNTVICKEMRFGFVTMYRYLSQCGGMVSVCVFVCV